MKPTQFCWPGVVLAVVASVMVAAWPATAQEKKRTIPHGQSQPPGKPLSPAEAIARMQVPEGFSVELVAAEPDIVNPVAMTFDERGRIWITESLEYPRLSEGPGKDRIKVLEDTTGDGRADRITVFAEGLNIPSGIAVGYGGVWVGNAPDILFLQDTDGDGRADRREVVVTGFGRHDTHELPNSFTWGPDGWLYGLNGVFNASHVRQGDREWKFTCAMFRIHPRTRQFELFCEGTSNPWGIAFDTLGSAFVSACVIDHLWHLTETGYYHRQAGAYPPFAWKINSIVQHKHQKAAYCGLHYFDSDAYPPEYRDKLYMGNIHGNCINSDAIERHGSTYAGRPLPDLLTANDAWFMPVVQKTGPDGCLYVLDWYDSYHCYQDARGDPEGIDRQRGRLYRIRYKNTPRVVNLRLDEAGDEELIRQLGSPNVYFRETAQRLLAERATPSVRQALQQVVLDAQAPFKQRMHALFALVGGGPLEKAFLLQLLEHPDAAYRSWAVRAAGNYRVDDPDIVRRVAALARDKSADVQLQVAIAANKLSGLDTVAVLAEVAAHCGSDPLIPHIVWQNLHPLLPQRHGDFLAALRRVPSLKPEAQPGIARMMPVLAERLLALEQPAEPVGGLLEFLLRDPAWTPAAGQTLAAIAQGFQSGTLKAADRAAFVQRLKPVFQQILAGSADGLLYFDAALLAVTLREPAGLTAVRRVLVSRQAAIGQRVLALEALIAANDTELLSAVRQVLAGDESAEFRGVVLASLGSWDEPAVAGVVLEHYPDLEPELKPKAIELLTTRAPWAHALLAAMDRGRVPREALGVNQVQKLLASRDQKLVEQVKTIWGTLRTQRNPQRENVIAQVRTLLRSTPGDPLAGEKVFHKVCGQCHKIYDKGAEVGPDLTRNGRNSLEQLLSNVLDPSLVIGAAYQARTVATVDGRVLVGLPVEEGPQRVVLKVQGGKLETLPRDQIDEIRVSDLSMMPEDLEKQISPQQMADLFAFLTLDKHPSDPTARQLPGVREIVYRGTSDPEQFAELAVEVAPGFSIAASGEGGVELLREHLGRQTVLRTHPVDRQTPSVLRGRFAIPKQGRTRLVVSVAHHPQGDWQLMVKADGKKLHEALIGAKTTNKGWTEMEIDLSSLAGQNVLLELENRANGWSYEFGYWGRVELRSE